MARLQVGIGGQNLYTNTARRGPPQMPSMLFGVSVQSWKHLWCILFSLQWKAVSIKQAQFVMQCRTLTPWKKSWGSLLRQGPWSPPQRYRCASIKRNKTLLSHDGGRTCQSLTQAAKTKMNLGSWLARDLGSEVVRGSHVSAFSCASVIYARLSPQEPDNVCVRMGLGVCVHARACVSLCVCVRACMCVCVCVCGGGGG